MRANLVVTLVATCLIIATDNQSSNYPPDFPSNVSLQSNASLFSIKLVFFMAEPELSHLSKDDQTTKIMPQKPFMKPKP